MENTSQLLTMNKPDLPPILNTKEYNSLVQKCKQEEKDKFQEWLEDCPVKYYQCDINSNVFEFNLPELNDPQKVTSK